MSQDSKKSGKVKPSKPHPDYPLFPHAAGVWAKKIRGRLHYFGSWADPEAALNKYLDEKDDLLAGRTPRLQTEELSLRDLCNRFMTAKQHLLDTREISPRTWKDYHTTCQRIIANMGVEKKVVNIVPLDFEHFRSRLAKNWSPVTLGNEIQRVRIVFKFAFDSGLIDVPIRYGSSFNRPSRRVLRKERAKKGVMMFEADDIRRMLDAADSSIKAMILLGINCGLGNSDIGNLPIDAADLNKKWLNYPRPKTGIDRRVPLWDETVTAIKKYMAKRPTPKQKEHKKLLFITKYGDAWHKNTSDNPISKEIRKLLDTLKLHRKGLGFYSLRHSFETVAGGAKDQVALDHVMGHVREDMASVYRERIEDERLLAVVSFVRSWLFPQTDSTTLKKGTKSLRQLIGAKLKLHIVKP